ncbi:MAG TPA: Gfo/Idh/MocA family oxidoreductase [Longimicrobiales bacterium]
MAERVALRVAVIGCGLMGRRRAAAVAAHPETRLAAVVDADPARAEQLADDYGCDVCPDWRDAVDRGDVDAVVVATPNGYLAEIGCAAVSAGKHVLLEKPMGRNLTEAQALAQAADGSGRLLKIGFNHRYHPGLDRLLAAVRAGEIGRVVAVRGRYGHGGRPGSEREWRADPDLAGGGHLIDQGVHLVDLIHAVAGLPEQAVAFLQTAVWQISPLEDNAHAMFRFREGGVAQIHVSMTQWRNLFSFEVHGETGSLAVEGLGGSYGTERLIRIRRRLEGGAPDIEEEEFPEPDRSWDEEWRDFVQATATGRLRCGGVGDGLAAMRMIDALYRSARSGRIVEV